MVKRKISVKKISIFIILLLLLIALITGVIMFLTKDKENKTVKIKNLDEIEEYGYHLSSNETKYYKSLFKELKKVLETDDIDEDKYAELITKLFVADFYNLDNKVNKNDIGGVQFVYKPFREDFKKLAADSIYKNIENNVYNNRKQELPIVENVSVAKEKQESFKYADQNDENAYLMSFDIEYKKDLKYQNKGTITIIHNDKKLEIAALTDLNSEKEQSSITN